MGEKLVQGHLQFKYLKKFFFKTFHIRVSCRLLTPVNITKFGSLVNLKSGLIEIFYIVRPIVLLTKI